MAKRSLSPNLVAQKLRKHHNAALVLAHQSARKAIKAQIRAQGDKLNQVPARTISIFAEAYFDVHRQETASCICRSFCLVSFFSIEEAASPPTNPLKWSRPPTNQSGGGPLAMSLAASSRVGLASAFIVCPDRHNLAAATLNDALDEPRQHLKRPRLLGVIFVLVVDPTNSSNDMRKTTLRMVAWDACPRHQ
jgi:hypothetical protein